MNANTLKFSSRFIRSRCGYIQRIRRSTTDLFRRYRLSRPRSMPISAQKMALARGARFDRGSTHMAITSVLRQSDWRGYPGCGSANRTCSSIAPTAGFAPRGRASIAAPGYQSVFVAPEQKAQRSRAGKNCRMANSGRPSTPFGLSTMVNPVAPDLLRPGAAVQPADSRVK